MLVRKLDQSDYYKNFFELLGQLTPTHNPSYQQFCDCLTEIERYNPTATIYVIEDSNKIIATAKLIIELKLHNNFAKMAHIEDVVVDEQYRGCGIGKVLIDYLCKRAEDCYKIVLNCGAQNVAFYEKCEFRTKGTEMVKYSNKKM